MNGQLTTQIQSVPTHSTMQAFGRVVGACFDASGLSVLLVVTPSDRQEQVRVSPVGIPVPSDTRCVAVLAGEFGPLCVWAWA